MKSVAIGMILILLVAGASALAIEKRAYRMREDFGTDALVDCTVQYYYYIPCPTYSWFWGFYGWQTGDIVGKFFRVGDNPTGANLPCDSLQCHHVTEIKVLDFAGYGPIYPGLFTVEFDIYCADASGCPLGPSLWNSGSVETAADWNTIVVDPPVAVTACCVDAGPPPATPRILVTATHTGTDASYPEWGTDNISSAVLGGCVMHDYGCLAALYPRPYTSHYTTMHSGYYGQSFAYCPPLWFQDDDDTSQDGSIYGFLELAWKVKITCLGPDAVEPVTWGSLKSLYR